MLKRFNPDNSSAQEVSSPGSLTFDEAYDTTALMQIPGAGIEAYNEYLAIIRREISRHLPPDVLFDVGTMTLEPDGHGALVTISVQAECAERVKKLIPHADVRIYQERELNYLRGTMEERAQSAA